MHDLKVIFMGTPDFSVPILEYLINNTNVVLVVTQPDKEVGRNKELSFSPVKKTALKYSKEVFQPIKIRKDYQKILDLKPDLIITCAFGQILPKEILESARLGSLNVHASFLPKYRGASPIQWALLNGDKKTGVTLMYMDEQMDTGDIINQLECDISDDDNVGSLHDKLSFLGVEILKQELPKIIKGTNNRIKQNNEKATYTKMIERKDELIDFNVNGNSIINKIRAFNPWPLAYFKLNNNEIKVYEAYFEKKDVSQIGKVILSKNSLGITCKDGIIFLTRIKPFGKKEMDIKSFINGLKKDVDLDVE